MNRWVANMLLLAIGVSSNAALAGGKSYMELVGELMGSVESPRVFRDYCATASPSTASEYSKLYSEWKERNKAMLAAIDVQVARAEVRLKKQGAPGGNKPADALREMVANATLQMLNRLDASQAAEFCNRYPSLLESKDSQLEARIARLLSVVAEADKSLSAREQT